MLKRGETRFSLMRHDATRKTCRFFQCFFIDLIGVSKPYFFTTDYPYTKPMIDAKIRTFDNTFLKYPTFFVSVL